MEKPEIDIEAAFRSSAFRKFDALLEALKTKYGYLKDDVNWSGILNIAMDLRGKNVFMDMYVGWGGDVRLLSKYLPQTFLNIRLNPAEMINRFVEQIEMDIFRLVSESGNPWLSGVCCINMDHQVQDEKVTAVLESVKRLRDEYRAEGSV